MRVTKAFKNKVQKLVEELSNLYSLGYMGQEADAYWVYVRKNPVIINCNGTFQYDAVKYPEYEEVLSVVKKYFKQA